MKDNSASRSLIHTLLLCTAIGTAGVVQAQRSCGTMEYLQQEIDADPARAAALQQADEHAAQYAIDHGHGEERSLVMVPVVVHVVWNTSLENVSDAHNMAQIDQLNLDFSRANSDAGNTASGFTGLAANTDIQFCLAQRDPSGNATTGIERRQTSISSFSTNNNVKRYSNGGLDAWPSSSYLNLWVCDLSGGVVGYAQFPGGSASTDGVVVEYGTVGSMAVPGTQNSFKYGRSATHEVGHWMNLRHIWGDDGNSCNGSDQVADTPNQADENYGCPNFPRISCSNGPNGDMFMNYMDYSDDLCMNLFTNGQADRMQSVFSPGGSRTAILNSMGCIAPGGGSSCAVPTGTSTFNVTAHTASVTWNAVTGADNYRLQYKKSSKANWKSVNLGGTVASSTSLAANTSYDWKVRSNCAGGSSDYSATITFTTPGNGMSQTNEPIFSETDNASFRLSGEYNATLAVYPNPTAGDVLMEYNAASAGQAHIDVVDAMGRIVFSVSTVVQAGPNSVELALPQMPDGIYLLRLLAGEQTTLQRIVVAH